VRRKIHQPFLSSGLFGPARSKCGFIEKSLYREGFISIIGVDEAGRGPLAGPVVAAAVSLPRNHRIRGIDDSKKLSRSKREKLYGEIMLRNPFFGIAAVGPEEIDRINILQAARLAMKRAVSILFEKIGKQSGSEVCARAEDFIIIVDGNQAIDVDPATPQRCYVSGDSRSENIAAASILAKVERDRVMDEIHREFPQYGFDRNRGYPTKEHIEALRQYGAAPYHRRSFRHVHDPTP